MKKVEQLTKEIIQMFPDLIVNQLSIDQKKLVNLELSTSNNKLDLNLVKLKIASLIKIKHQYPGLKIEIKVEKPTDQTSKKIKYLGIASGKGGVGKSSVIANLAVAFSQLGIKVGIIDADVYGASIPHIFNIPANPLSTTDDDLIIPYQRDHLQIVSPLFFMPRNQPLMWRGPMLWKLLSNFFEGVKWDEDTQLILIDLPPGTGDVALDIAENIPKTKMIVITTPHMNAAKVALRAGIGALEIGHEVLGVIENMSYYFNPCSHEKEFLFGTGGGQFIADELKVPLLAQIPINPPENKDEFIYQPNEMNAKIFLSLAKSLLEKIK